MSRCFVLLSGIVLTLGLCQAAWGVGPRPDYPRPCPNVCVPNVWGFGYFPTTWRQWPGEHRLEQINPRAVNAEVLPTPEGQEQLPLPKGLTQPQPPPAAAPEGGGILPPQVPGALPEPPTEPKPEEPSQSPVEGGLPGLPVESDQPLLPPSNEGEQATGPSSDLNPPSAPAPESVPKSPTNDKSQPGARRESTERSTATGAAFDNQDVQRGTVVSLAGGFRAEWSRSSPGAYRADSIAVAAPEPAVNDVEAAAYATVESPGAVEVTDENVALPPVALPPVALHSYCPVELTRNGRWTPGDLRWTVVHNGLVYRLSGPAQRQQFLADPEAFAPAYSGNDPVLAMDQHRTVPGQAAYCTTCNGRLYMFSSAATQSQFNSDPQRYAVGK